MELSDELYSQFNAQMNIEFESAYLYLSMSVYFETKNLPGFAVWMKGQYDEERDHAFKFYNFILDRDKAPMLSAFGKPESIWKSVLDVFEASLKHEQFITTQIYDLMNTSFEEKDYAAKGFLDWFVQEQVEEENTVRTIIDQIKMVQDTPSALFLLDREIGKRNNITVE